MLRSKFFTSEQVEAIVRDFHSAGLPAKDVAMLDFAVKLTDHAYKITPRDVDGLRNFISKLVDALGAEPDPSVHELDAGLRTALDVAGRLRR